MLNLLCDHLFADALADHACCGIGGQICNGNIHRNALIQKDAVFLAIFRQVDDSMLDGIAGVANTDLLSVQIYLTADNGVCAEDCAGKFRAPGAHESRQANHFTGPDLNSNILQQFFLGEVSHIQHHIANLGVARRKLFRDFTAHHQFHQAVDGLLRPGGGRHKASIPEHRDPVDNLVELLQSVRNIHNADAIGLQLPENPEENLHLFFRKCRGRLIQNQHLGLHRQRLGNLCHLLLGHAEIPHFFVGIHG